MEALQRVLRQSTGDLAGSLVGQVGIQESVAVRFVDVAGADLIGSYAWQESNLDLDHLSAPANVRDLMSALNAGRIAKYVGLPVTEVWKGLRAFVPHVVQLTERQSGRPASARSAGRPRDTRRKTRAHAGASTRLARPSPLHPRA